MVDFNKLVLDIYENLSNDMGIYFDEIQGHEEETITEIETLLLNGDKVILDNIEEGSDLYNKTLEFINHIKS